MAGFTLGNFSQTLKPSIQNSSPSNIATPKKSSSLLSRLVNTVTSTPKYFLNTDIINPTKELAAQFSGNNVAYKNAVNAQKQTIGATPGEATKRLVGNTAGLATTLLAPETKIGLGAKIVQGAKIGATAGAGSALANDQNVVKGALEGAATGGATAGLLSKITKGKAASSGNEDMVQAAKQANGVNSPVASLGSKAQKYGTDLLANKLNVSARDAQKFAGPQTVQRLQAEHGLTVQQAAKLHPVITGGEGVSTTVHNAALEKMGNVNFKDFATNMKAHVNDPEYQAANLPDGASSAQAKNLKAVIDKYHAGLNPASDKVLTRGSTEGAKIDSGTNAKSAMDMAKNLEKQGYSNQASSSPTKQALSDLQLKMADTIKNHIYNAPGGQDALEAAKAETAAHLDALAQQSGNSKLSKVADAFRAANTHEEFRNVSSPFVNAKALVDKTDLNNFANKGRDSGNGGLFATVKKGASKIASPIAGKVLSKVGDKLTSSPIEQIVSGHPNTDILAKLTSNPQAMTLLRNAGITGAAGAAANPPAKSPSPQAGQEVGASSNDSNDTLGFATAPSTDALGKNGSAAGSTGSSFSEQDLIASINSDPKNASTYIALFNALKPSASSSTTGKVTAQQKGLASTGLSGLQAIAQEIQDNPSVVTHAATPGQNIPLVGGFITNRTGAGSYEANANQVLDSLARLRTGAAMSKSEETFYRNLLPKAGDSPETINTKLSDLQGAFSQFATQ